MGMWTTEPYKKFQEQAPPGWEFQMYDHGGDMPVQELGKEKTLVKKIPLNQDDYLEARTRYFWVGETYTLKLVVCIYRAHFEKIWWSGKVLKTFVTTGATTITLATKCARKDYRRVCSCVRSITDKDLFAVAATLE